MAAQNDIDKAKKKALDSIRERIKEMSDVASTILIKQIEKSFDIKSGKIVPDKNFIRQLNRLTVDVLDLLQKSPQFSGPVSGFLKRMPAISDAITDFQKSTNGVKVPSFEITKKIVVDEITEQLLNNGLNQNFVQPLRDLIYQNVSGGLSLTDAKTQIKEFIKGSPDKLGKLSQYIDQTAEQAVDAYSGAINKKLIETFDYDGLLMTGSLIDNSSPQCVYAIETLKGRITRENWSQIEAIGKKQSGWIEGTTFDNVPVNKLHWGCRHSFYPIILKKAA